MLSISIVSQSIPQRLTRFQCPFLTALAFKGIATTHRGIAAALFAVARGAGHIEKHFTLNKAQQGPTEKGHLGAMNLNELMELRQYADDTAKLRNGAEDLL